MMLASARGVSTTRAPPNRSTSPLVVRKTPPSLPTSRPSTITRGSCSISSLRALLIASTMLRSGIYGCPSSNWSLPVDTRGRVLVDVVEEVAGSRERSCESGFEGRVDLVAQLLGQIGFASLIPETQTRQVFLDPLDGVAPAGLFVLGRVPVTRRVVGGVVEAHAIRDRLDEGRPVTFSGFLDSADDDVVDGHHIIAVDLDAFEAVAGRPQREARGGGLDAP